MGFIQGNTQMTYDRINKVFLCFMCFILSVSAHAEVHTQKLNGIAFAQAAEIGSSYCVDEKLDAAANCARSKCEQSKAAECFVTKWCWPAQISGELQVYNDDLQFIVPMCGFETEAGLIASAKARCEHIGMPATCALISKVDKNGRELPLPETRWRSAK